MILCVNLNAAIDKTVVVNSFRLNAIHRPRRVLAVPGGKGANVARGLKCLGEAAVVAGWVGGFSGQFIEAGLRREGIETALVHLQGEPVPEEKIAEFKRLFRSVVAQHAAVTLSGSLPPGVPADFYSELMEIAR